MTVETDVTAVMVVMDVTDETEVTDEMAVTVETAMMSHLRQL